MVSKQKHDPARKKIAINGAHNPGKLSSQERRIKRARERAASGGRGALIEWEKQQSKS